MNKSYRTDIITSLPATDVDDDIGVGVLGQSLRDDSFPATESSGDGGGTTLDTTGTTFDIFDKQPY